MATVAAFADESVLRVGTVADVAAAGAIDLDAHGGRLLLDRHHRGFPLDRGVIAASRLSAHRKRQLKSQGVIPDPPRRSACVRWLVTGASRRRCDSICHQRGIDLDCGEANQRLR